MNFDRLTALLLERAIRGELVPQLDSEPAVEQIGEAPKDVPFAIPRKWKWVLFKETLSCLDKKRIPVKKADREKQKKLYDYYGATGVIDKVEGYLFDKRLLLIGEDGANLISKSKDNAFIADGKYWVNNHAHVFDENGVALIDYVAFYVNSISLVPYVTGTAQPKLTLKSLSGIPVPLPPVDEQRRIVLKLNELLGEVNRAKESYDDLCKFGESFRKKVLRDAMRGALVPQIDVEPAVEQLGDAPVGVPFDIPKKWKWVRLQDVADINPRVKPNDENVVVSFIPMASVSAGYDGKITIGDERVWSSVKNGYTKFSNGDVILAKITPCFQNRKSAIANNLKNGIGCGSSEFHVIRASADVDPEYVLMFLKSEWFIRYGMDNFKGTAGQQRLGTKELKTCPFPLPPLPEQRRITAKSKKLFGEVNRLLGQ